MSMTMTACTASAPPRIASANLKIGTSRGASRARAASKPTTSGRQSVVLRALSEDEEEAAAVESAAQAAAKGMGFDTSEGIFGFTPFAELWVGRLAMTGFTVGLAEELWTGDGILSQIGVATPNPTVTAVLTLLLVGGSAAGSAQTLARVQNGEMSYAQFKKYVAFFGADGDKVAESLAIDVKKMETPGALGASDVALPGLDVVSAATKGNPAESMDDVPLSVSADKEYMLGVEMNNGRWAMIGFALAVAIESATGRGIVGQLVWYAKISGALGPDSGF